MIDSYRTILDMLSVHAPIWTHWDIFFATNIAISDVQPGQWCNFIVYMDSLCG